MEHIHGGNITRAVERYNLKEEDIIDFSANINFLGPPPQLLEEIRNNLAKIIHYPEPNSTTLKRKMGQYLDLEEKNLVIGNGAVELIYQLVKVIKPDLALVMAPTFSEYELAVKSCGGRVKYLRLEEEKGFKIDIEEVVANLDRVKIVFLCNPNNPTGTLIKRSELMDLIDYASRKDVFVIIDEAFIDFIDNPGNYTVIDLIVRYSNLFVLRSLTKFYAIPGLRLGYGAGTEELISKMELARDPWSVNFFAQLAGEIVLKDVEYQKETRRRISLEREFLYNSLKKIDGLKPFPPSANYIFIDIGASNFSSIVLAEILARRGILIRDCSSYRGLGENYIRVAVKSREDNCFLLDNLREII